MDEKDPQELAQDAVDAEAAEDAAVARVRAADPAATAVPDTTTLRAAVDERRAEPTGVVPDELAARRARRWTTLPAKIASVAAAALILGGGGGYAIGASGAGSADDGGDLVADAAAPPMSLDVPGGEMATDEEATTGFAPNVGAMPESDRYWGGGRTVFTSSGLSTEGTTLHAWGFDAAVAFTEQTIAAAAAAFGVAGTPQQVDGTWTVGPNDGTGPTVQLYPDGTVSLSYWDPTKDLYYCPVTLDEDVASAPDAGGGTDAVEPGAGTEDSGVVDSGEAEPGVVAPEPAPDPCQPRDFGPAPTGEDAAQVLRDALTALGLDPAGFEFQVDHYEESPESTYVTAYQVVNGQRSGVAWSASLTGAGLQSLYGAVAPLVDIGEYQVVSPVEAVERLMDPRFGSGYYGPLYYAEGMGPGARDDIGTATEVAPAPSVPTVPPTVGVGSAFSWPVETATIVEARLGLALHTQMDGSAVLVPTYELVSDAGAVWSVIAVADAHLDFAAAG